MQIRDYIGYQLLQVMKAHRRIAEPAFAQLGLHPGQEMILFELWQEDGLCLSELAAGICVEPPTITKMVQRMEAAGILERRADTQDARITRVYLTERGKALEAPVNQLWADLEAQTVIGLSEAEKMLMRRLLLQLQENLAR